MFGSSSISSSGSHTCEHNPVIDFKLEDVHSRERSTRFRSLSEEGKKSIGRFTREEHRWSRVSKVMAESETSLTLIIVKLR